MRRHGYSMLGLGLLLAACGSTARSTMITADTALVTVVGARDGGGAALVQATLREAARMTRAQGYRYFVVLDTADASIKGHKIDPPARVYGEGVSGLAYLSRANPRTRANEGGMQTPVGESVLYIRPGLDMSIRMYRAGAIDPAMDGVFDSDEILAKAGRRPWTGPAASP
jgi:hypothetical protein